MNILYLINHAGKGGTEKYIKLMAEYCMKNDKVYFIYNEKGLLVEQMEKLGVECEQLCMKNPFDFKAVKILAKFCEEKEIDIIHTQFQRENYIALLTKRIYKKVKVIYTAHIIVQNNFIWKITNSYICKNDDAIIAVCNKGAEILIKNKMPEDKIKVIWNGVNYKDYTHNVKNSTMRKDYNIPVDEFVFLTVTRLSKEKGVDFLLESVKLLTTLVDIPFKVLIVGDGLEEGMLKEYVLKNELVDKVIFTGFREDVENILMGSNCFINSSSNEALSFAILEAMSKALPIIATKVGGNTDIVNEQSGNGILVRYKSTVQLAKAMEKMMTKKDFAKECSANSIKSIKENFNIVEKINDTYDLYKKINNNEVF